MKQLDKTAEKQQEGEGEKCKAGFWEEFEVRVYLTCYYVNSGVRAAQKPFTGFTLYQQQDRLYTATLRRSDVIATAQDWPNECDGDYTVRQYFWSDL